MTWQSPGYGDGMHIAAKVTGGKPVKHRAVRRREVVDKGTTFTAFDAHDLLDMDSHAKYGRPGMSY